MKTNWKKATVIMILTVMLAMLGLAACGNSVSDNSDNTTVTEDKKSAINKSDPFSFPLSKAHVAKAKT